MRHWVKAARALLSRESMVDSIGWVTGSTLVFVFVAIVLPDIKYDKPPIEIVGESLRGLLRGLVILAPLGPAAVAWRLRNKRQLVIAFLFSLGWWPTCFAVSWVCEQSFGFQLLTPLVAHYTLGETVLYASLSSPIPPVLGWAYGMMFKHPTA